MSTPSNQAISKNATNGLSSFFQKHGSLVALILIVIAASLRYDTFFTQTNIINMLRQNSMLGYIAIGMTFVILTRGIDLSVGSLLAISALTAAVMSPFGLFWALAVPIIVSTALGSVNGLLIAKAKIEPFIVTLAMMIGVRGFVYAYTHERTMSVDPSIADAFKVFGRGVVLGIPVPIWIFAVLLLLAGVVLKYTSFGRHVFAVGGNEEASKLMGLRTDRIKILVYAISGGLSGLAGIVLASRLGGVAQPVAGEMWELDAIAAVAIGGTLLTGGRGSIFGTFVGIMLMGVILNIINMEGSINSWWQPIIRGLFLIVIVIVQAKLNKGSNKLKE
ncbi:ABC transporter permease [Ferviditalea candida]|uniref:Ribose ABC transporter permease n=1 Tax=Ferviditalea candida TaxID=3108399 RepID=A0ABU5ZJ01_9BACL|nr:ribose ABC transporter permease [Paenibacillaceae bacterium T2]